MLLGVTSEQMQNIAIAVVFVLLALAVLLGLLVKKLVVKLLTIGVLAVLAVLVWGQRANLAECADQVQQEATARDDGRAACSIFGIEVDVPIPELPDLPGGTTTTTVAP
jgi:hypothetical protein